MTKNIANLNFKNMITPELIKALVESESKINDISVRSRKRKIVELRFCYYHLAHKFCIKPKVSIQEIGNVVGVDHSTVLHGKKQLVNFLGKKVFTANDVYYSVHKRLVELISEDKEEKLMHLDDAILVNQYWRRKHIRLIDKTHSVLNKYIKRVKLLEERLSVLDKDTIHAINNLSEKDLRKFNYRNAIFFKVTESLNKQKV